MVKSCLEEDWGPDLRFAACSLIEKIILVLNAELEGEELRQIYPVLLERLDDAQDQIRIEITKSIIAFFTCKNVKNKKFFKIYAFFFQMGFSESILEYIVKGVFVHLDDQNEDIQMSIYNVLRFMAKLKPKLVLDEAKDSLKKFKYPRKCQELINYSQERIEEENEK